MIRDVGDVMASVVGTNPTIAAASRSGTPERLVLGLVAPGATLDRAGLNDSREGEDWVGVISQLKCGLAQTQLGMWRRQARRCWLEHLPKWRGLGYCFARSGGWRLMRGMEHERGPFIRA